MTASKVHCQRHVLSVENATERGWLGVDALSDAIDKYSACHNNNNRPQAFAIGQNVMYTVLSSLAACGRLGVAAAAGVFVCHA